jgi:serine/threonine protein kinase
MTTQQQEEQERIQKPNPKPKQPKNPNPPPKDKILINLKSLGEVSTKLQDLLTKSNNKDYGRTITATDIFARSILKFSEADIMLLQRSSITTDLDILKFEWSMDQQKAEEKIDFPAWLLKKLKLKTNHKELQ